MRLFSWLEPIVDRLQFRAQPNPNANKVKNVQAQVDEVFGIMQSNVEKVVDRGDKLDQLQSKTGTRGK